jgi:hypothetical protein
MAWETAGWVIPSLWAANVMLRSSQTCVKISSVRKSYPENGFMWLGHDGIAVGLRSIISKKEYLVQKLAILNLRLDNAVGATSRGMTRIIPRKYSIS